MHGHPITAFCGAAPFFNACSANSVNLAFAFGVFLIGSCRKIGLHRTRKKRDVSIVSAVDGTSRTQGSYLKSMNLRSPVNCRVFPGIGSLHCESFYGSLLRNLLFVELHYVKFTDSLCPFFLQDA